MERDRIYLRHILDAIEKIERYTAGLSFKDFETNDLVFDAVVRELEIIGEAAGNVSDACRSELAGVPFKDMTSMRNRLIHRYFGVDASIVWKTCKEDLAAVRSAIDSTNRRDAA